MSVDAQGTVVHRIEGAEEPALAFERGAAALGSGLSAISRTSVDIHHASLSSAAEDVRSGMQALSNGIRDAQLSISVPAAATLPHVADAICTVSRAAERLMPQGVLAAEMLSAGLTRVSAAETSHFVSVAVPGITQMAAALDSSGPHCARAGRALVVCVAMCTSVAVFVAKPSSASLLEVVLSTAFALFVGSAVSVAAFAAGGDARCLVIAGKAWQALRWCLVIAGEARQALRWFWGRKAEGNHRYGARKSHSLRISTRALDNSEELAERVDCGLAHTFAVGGHASALGLSRHQTETAFGARFAGVVVCGLIDVSALTREAWATHNRNFNAGAAAAFLRGSLRDALKVPDGTHCLALLDWGPTATESMKRGLLSTQPLLEADIGPYVRVGDFSGLDHVQREVERWIELTFKPLIRSP